MSYSDVILADSPELFYRLDENPTPGGVMLDSSGYARHGVHGVNGAAQAPESAVTALVGDPGSAAYYRSTQSDRSTGPWAVPALNIGSPATSFTFEAWLKFPASPPQNSFIFTFGSSTDQGPIIGLMIENATTRRMRGMMRAHSSQAPTDDFSVTSTGTNPFDDPNAQHWVFPYNAADGRRRLYKNGVLDAIVFGSGVAADRNFPTDRVGVGALVRAAVGPYCNVIVDEAAFYRHALTPERILAHYNAGLGIFPSDVVPPVVALSSGPTKRMSDEAGKDSYDYSFQANEDVQAWKVKIVGSPSDAHTEGTTIDSGGALTANTVQSGSVTYAELVGAGVGAEGTKVLKVFVQDLAGNWSAENSDPWPASLADWGYRRKFSVNKNDVPGIITNHLLALDLTSDSHFADNTKIDRSDIRFADINGNLLAHEWEDIDPAILTGDGAWCWFGAPAAIWHNDALYLSWVNSINDILVAKYDSVSKVCGFFVVRSGSTILSGGRVDDHSNPSIVFDSNDRLHIFYSAHSGANMFHRKSVNPEDITAWGPETTLPNRPSGTDFTYPNPHKIGDRIYMMWRANGSNGLGGPPAMTYSDDDGQTWATPRPLIANTTGGGQRPYAKYESDGEFIHCFCTDGHPREYTPPGTSIFHFKFNDTGIYKTDGTFICTLGNLASGPMSFDDVTKVFDSSSSSYAGWVWDIAVLPDGRPVGVYAATDEPLATDHHYFYAVADENGLWSTEEITPAGGGTIGGPVDSPEPQYSPGLILDHVNPAVVFLSRWIAGSTELEKWTRYGPGVWETQKITELTVGSIENVRPITVRGRAGVCPEVIWMQGYYGSFIDYYTSLRCWPAMDLVDGPKKARVSIPQLDSATDVSIFMYYGNEDAPVRKRAPYGPNAVAYSGADDSVLGEGVKNLTYFKPHGRKVVSGPLMTTKPTQVPVPFGNMQHFGGHPVGWIRGERVNVAGWSGITIFALVKALALSDGSVPDMIWSNWATSGIYGANASSPAVSGALFRRHTNNALNGVIAINNASVGGSFNDLVIPVDGNLHTVALAYSAASGLVRAYLDATPSTTTYASTSNLDSDLSGPASGMGHDVHGGDQTLHSAFLDIGMLRVAARELSANEILTEHRNLKNAGFVIAGALETN